MARRVAVLCAAACVGAARGWNHTLPLGGGGTIPQLGLGTYLASGAALYETTRDALALGYRHIDTAEVYRNGGAIADALRDAGVARGDVFITSKVSWYHMRSFEAATAAIERLLAELRLEYVDLLLVHFPPMGGCGALNCPVIQSQWAALESFYAQKKAKSIGVSNFCVTDDLFFCIWSQQSREHFFHIIDELIDN